MTNTEDTFRMLGSDGRVTYTSYSAAPSDVHVWDYWASDRASTHFRFELVPFGDHFRIYILMQPSYQGRAEDLVPTHRHRDEIGRYYICILPGNEPQTVGEAMSWYSYWAERTIEYIATGRRFT
jgi:hypothetical protein